MLNCGIERTTDNGTLLSRGPGQREGEDMVQRFQGIDRHKNYSMVSVLDRDGHEVRFLRSCAMEDYLAELGAEDACGGVADQPAATRFWALSARIVGCQRRAWFFGSRIAAPALGQELRRNRRHLTGYSSMYLYTALLIS